LSFFEELKQRNVVRVGIAYAVSAWVVAQLADLTLGNFDAPGWIIKAVLIGLAVGFPLALVLAWAYELTPDGIKREQEFDRSAAGKRKGRRPLDLAIIVLLFIALAYFVYDKFFLGESVGEKGAEPISVAEDPAAESEDGKRALTPTQEASSPAQSPDAASASTEKSIAVLPFENFSGNESEGYFADGLADTLLNKLAQIEGLKVIARNSSFQFKGTNRDAREIGKILGVRTLLEGSVQRAGNDVRVIAQLINTTDGVHLWSQSFDGRMENIFELQDRIAGEIVSNLQVNLSEDDRARVLRNGTDNPQAYDLVMLARAERGELTTDKLAEANEDTFLPLQLLKRAVKLDPDYAQAWVAISAVYNSLAFATGSGSTFEHYAQQSLQAAQTAIEIDPGLAEAYTVLGFYYWRTGNVNEAVVNYRQALKLNSNSAAATSGLGLALINTDPAEAYRLLSQAGELDPNAKMIYRQKSFALNALDQIDKAVQSLEEGVQRFPQEGIFYYDLAQLYDQYYGRPDLAAVWVSRYLAATGITLNGGIEMASYWRNVADFGRAQAWLDFVQQKFGASDALLSAQTRIDTAKANYAALSAGTLRVRENLAGSNDDGYSWNLRSEAVACLAAGSYACVLQKGLELQQKYELNSEKGLAIENVRRIALLLQGSAWMAQGKVEQAQEILQPLLEDVSSDPLVRGNFNNPGKQYLAAEINSILGQADAALQELEASLALADGGIISRDFLGQAPESNLFLASLRGDPRFEDWLTRFTARRDAIYQDMLELEGNGDIILPSTKGDSKE
jgi:TolB-like protein/Tfp pilus assembly protein PilF